MPVRHTEHGVEGEVQPSSRGRVLANRFEPVLPAVRLGLRNQ